jgi:hypothetical protein
VLTSCYAVLLALPTCHLEVVRAAAAAAVRKLGQRLTLGHPEPQHWALQAWCRHPSLALLLQLLLPLLRLYWYCQGSLCPACLLLLNCQDLLFLQAAAGRYL